MENSILDEIKKVADLDKKNVEQTALKLMEECGEVAEAVLSFTKAPACGYKGKTKNDIVEECSDVIIVAYTLLASKLGVSKEEVVNTLMNKLNKWESKIKNDLMFNPNFPKKVTPKQLHRLAEYTRVSVVNTKFSTCSGLHILRKTPDNTLVLVNPVNGNYYKVDEIDTDCVELYITEELYQALSKIEEW